MCVEERSKLINMFKRHKEKGRKRLFFLFGVDHQPHQATEVTGTESINK